MDTNQKQPIQTNTFGKGMNTDISDALLGSDQYRLARNLRYTTNTEENTGELHMIDGVRRIVFGEEDPEDPENKGYYVCCGRKISSSAYDFDNNIGEIIASTSIRNIGIIIDKTENTWKIRRFNKDLSTIFTEDVLGTPVHYNMMTIFGPCSDPIGDNLSLVTRYESDDVIHLYIADGEHNIMTLNINEYYTEDQSTIENIISTPQIKLAVPKFYGLTYGRLKSGLVQYSYKLYKKYGYSSEISPTTKLIQIVNDASISLTKDKKITGGEYDKVCNCGVKLFIDVDINDKNRYDQIIIYRIHYAQNGQLPTIENIADIKLDLFTGSFVDDGRNANEQITLEEYNSNSGIHIIPAVIESKNDYLFAARIKSLQNTIDSDILQQYDTRSFSFNSSGQIFIKNAASDYEPVNDDDWVLGSNLPSLTHDCINGRNDLNLDVDDIEDQYNCIYKSSNVMGGKGAHIDWEFVTGELIVDGQDDLPYISANTSFSLADNKVNPFEVDDNNNWWKHYVNEDADSGDYMFGYANPYTSYLMKSLRRNELYRFGIIFYDKYGTASAVKWIADIRTPDILESSPFIKSSHSIQTSDPAGKPVDDLRAKPLGIKFTIHDGYPEGTVAYEIVRCNRKESDILNLQQGVLSRPQQNAYRQNYNGSVEDTFTPTGFLTTTNYAIINETGSSIRATNRTVTIDDGLDSDNIANRHVFQFISAEALYNEDSIFNFDLLKLDTLKYIYPVYYNTTTGTVKDTFGLGLNSYSQYVMLSSNEFQFRNNHAILGNYYWDATDSNKEYLHYGIPFTILDYCIHRSYYKDKNENNTSWRYLSTNGLYVYSQPNSDTRWYDYVNKHYIYQKLYNNPSSNNVFCQPHRASLLYLPEYMEDDDVSANTIVYLNVKHSEDPSNTIPYLPATVVLRTKHCDFKITDIQKANELKWNSIGKESGGSVNDPLLFVGNVVAIGDKTYCNFVSGPLYKASLTLDALKRENDNPVETGRITNVPIGPAGRCLLLYISEHENESGVVYASYSSPITVKANRLLDTVAAVDINTSTSDVYSYVKIVDPHRESKIIPYASMMGTYICNLKHNVTPYGGNTYSDRLQSTYYSYGDIHSVEESSPIIFNGDTFLNPVEYVSMHKCYDPNIINVLNACIVLSIPLETSINVAMTYGNEFSRNLESLSIVNLQIEPSNVYNKYVQTDPLYVYNSVYSASSLARLYQPLNSDIDNENINNKDYRCYHSAPKGNNEFIDSWLKFLPADYIDVDTRYGAITQLRTFHNQLMFWQENATGIFSVNERTAVTDNSNLPLILGTGGILSRYDYLMTSNGMHENDFSDAQSDSTLYWWDRNHNELCAYSGGQQSQSLSKIKGVQNYLNRTEIIEDKPCLLYDKKYNEMIAHTTNNDESLVYSEYVAAFTSLYDIAFGNKIEFSDTTFIINNDEMFKLNVNVIDGRAYGTKNLDEIHPYLKYIVNDNPQIVKTFDNIMFGGRMYGGEDADISSITFKFDTPLKQHSETHRADHVITNREYDFKLAIPRNEAREPIDSGQQWRSKFEERMKGKTMQCELLSDSNSTDFSLQYITTKYRQSWS